MPQTQPSLAQRIFAPAAALGALALSCLDKWSGSSLFGDPTLLTTTLGAGAATLSGFTVNVLSSKLWQDHTDQQRENAIAAALLENGAISRHIGNILAALVTDAGTKLGHEEIAGPLAKAIPEAWQRILKDNPQAAAALDGPEYARDLLKHLARTEASTPLDPEDIALILRTAADTIPDIEEAHVTALAQAVAHRLADAAADALTSPHPEADRAFRRALLNCHAQIFTAAQQTLSFARLSLSLAKSHDARLAQLIEIGRAHV